MKAKFLKKLMAMALIACMGCAVVGCSDNGDETSNNDSGKNEQTTFEILEELNLDDYITLGNYKGLKLEKEVQIATEKEVQEEIKVQLENYPVKVTDRTVVKDGDTVNIDFVGRMDGEVFSGGSATNVGLIIGSGSFIDGFESGLIGAVVGEECVLDLKFPDPYTKNPDFSGKPVEFTVVVNSIDKAPLEAPTDEWVQENFEECSTVAEFEEWMKMVVQEVYDETAQAQLAYNGWQLVLEDTTIHKYPDVLVENGEEQFEQELEAYLQYYSMDLEDYLSYIGMSEKEYEENVTIGGQNFAAQAMISYAICQKEGIEINGEEFKAELKVLAEEYDCTEEELYETYAQDDIEQTVFLNLACNLIVEEAEVTEVESSNSTK